MNKLLLVALTLASLLSVPLGHGRSRRNNHIGKLLSMETVQCGPEDVGTVSKAIFGGAMPAAEERLCPEYILQSEGLYYRIRPRNHKHPALLPIGEQAQFHFQKDRLLLQIEDFDDQTYEFVVLAIIPENHIESLRPPRVMLGSPE